MQGSEFSAVQLVYVGNVVKNVSTNSSRRLLQTSKSAVQVCLRSHRLEFRVGAHRQQGAAVAGMSAAHSNVRTAVVACAICDASAVHHVSSSEPQGSHWDSVARTPASHRESVTATITWTAQVYYNLINVPNESDLQNAAQSSSTYSALQSGLNSNGARPMLLIAFSSLEPQRTHMPVLAEIHCLQRYSSS